MARRKQTAAAEETIAPSGIVHCERCNARCRIDPKHGSKAKMLKRGKGSGLCVNCATHDFLRHQYPINIQLAESGPRILLYPHVSELFADIMRTGNADANPDEINWNLMVENWELPWPYKMATLPTNPVTEEELEEIRQGRRRGLRYSAPPPDPLGGKMTIDSFDDLNKLEPGLGDDLKSALDRQLNSPSNRADGPRKKRPDPPTNSGGEQQRLF